MKQVIDADGLLVRTAIPEAPQHDSVVITGEDVDILVILTGITAIKHTQDRLVCED